MAHSTGRTHDYEVLFLGHSYIRRLSEFIFSGKHEGVRPDFGLNRDRTTAYFRGIGGARVETIMRDLPRTLNSLYKPDVVFLQIGGNDILFDDDDMGLLAERVFHLAHMLHSEFLIPQVIVSQLFCRAVSKCAEYNSLVVLFNTHIAALIKDYGCSGLVFWRHQGFWSDAARAQVQHKDGICLNVLGNHIFYNSCKSAIIQAIVRMHQG